MALLAAQQIQVTGTTVTFAAATAGAGDTFVWDDDLMVEVKNASGSPITATLAIPGATFGQNNPDIAVNVPATNGHVRIGPIPREAIDPTTGVCNVTYSAATSVTVGLSRL